MFWNVNSLVIMFYYEFFVFFLSYFDYIMKIVDSEWCLLVFNMVDGDVYEVDLFKKKLIKIEVLVSVSKISFEVVIYIILN